MKDNIQICRCVKFRCVETNWVEYKCKYQGKYRSDLLKFGEGLTGFDLFNMSDVEIIHMRYLRRTVIQQTIEF